MKKFFSPNTLKPEKLGSNQIRVLRGWYLYDWANSAYVTNVLTVFFGPFISQIASKIANPKGLIEIVGLTIYSDSLYSYLVSISVLLQFFFLPLIAAFVDVKGKKLNFLILFALLGSILTLSFSFLNEKHFNILSITFIFSNFFFGASVVVYNSLLNHICEPEKRDIISSKGWAIGYIGGGINLALNLVFIYFHNFFDFSIDDAIRIAFGLTALWWVSFSLLSFYWMRGFSFSPYPQSSSNKKILLNLFKTIRELAKNKNAWLFLVAYLFFNDGVQTVIVISTQFGRRELNLSMDFLVLTILLVQFLSYFGTIIVARITQKLGSKKTIIICLIIWNIIIIYSYFFLRDWIGFAGLAFSISLVLGGTQALSRSIFSNLIPEKNATEYFSLYEISEKGSSWIGPLVFGLILQVTKSYRFAILSLILFFLVGIFLISIVKVPSYTNKVTK